MLKTKNAYVPKVTDTSHLRIITIKLNKSLLKTNSQLVRINGAYLAVSPMLNNNIRIINSNNESLIIGQGIIRDAKLLNLNDCPCTKFTSIINWKPNTKNSNPNAPLCPMSTSQTMQSKEINMICDIHDDGLRWHEDTRSPNIIDDKSCRIQGTTITITIVCDECICRFTGTVMFSSNCPTLPQNILLTPENGMNSCCSNLNVPISVDLKPQTIKPKQTKNISMSEIKESIVGENVTFVPAIS